MHNNKKYINKVLDEEEKRMHAMQELLTDYIDTIKNQKLPEEYNLKKWVASELIIYLANYVGETQYEKLGIIDECKHEIRERYNLNYKSLHEKD